MAEEQVRGRARGAETHIPWFPLIMLVPAILLLAGLLPLMARNWQAQRSYAFQLDAEEGFILNQALTLARGQSIYQPLDRPPFVVGNYTPLFPAVYALLNGGQARPDSLPNGRLLVELAALGAALGLGVIVALRHRRRLPLVTLVPVATLAPLLFLVSFETFHWSAFVRVDFLALLLTVAGLGVFLLARARWGAALAGALFVAAVYTRQTAILAPLACALALLLQDRRRLFAWFLPACLVCGLIPLAWLEWRTGGEFLRHTFTYNQNRMDWTGWRRLMLNEVWFFDRWWILALVSLGLARLVGKARRADCACPKTRGLQLADCEDMESGKRTDEQGLASPVPVAPANSPKTSLIPAHARHAVGIYAALGALSLLSYAKVGAAPNYVLEPLLAAALWGADSLAWLLGRPDERLAGKSDRVRPAGAGVAARVAVRALLWESCLLVLFHAVWLSGLAGRFPWSPVPRPPDRAAVNDVRVEARNAPGDILSEEPIFALLADKPVLFQPFIMSQLAREGRWDERPFLKMLEEKRFSLLIVTEDLAQGGPETNYERYTPAMAAAVRRNYDLADRLALPTLGKAYYLWRSKGL